MNDSSGDSGHWARAAKDWIAWARTPNHDAFWAYRPSLASFIGSGRGEALDLGCGEGRTSRLLKELGYQVTAVDAVAELVDAAIEAGSADTYATADATALPCASGRFDLVVAYNLLMNVGDVSAVLREAHRVLRPDGQLVVSLVHPWRDKGEFIGDAPDAPFVLTGDYFEQKSFSGTEERNGLRMSFAGWSRPLEDYMAALEECGFAVTSLREPKPSNEPEWEHLKPWSRIPLFLWLKARPLERQSTPSDLPTTP